VRRETADVRRQTWDGRQTEYTVILSITEEKASLSTKVTSEAPKDLRRN